jgi:hypothetical protein
MVPVEAVLVSHGKPVCEIPSRGNWVLKQVNVASFGRGYVKTNLRDSGDTVHLGCPALEETW